MTAASTHRSIDAPTYRLVYVRCWQCDAEHEIEIEDDASATECADCLASLDLADAAHRATLPRCPGCNRTLATTADREIGNCADCTMDALEVRIEALT